MINAVYKNMDAADKKNHFAVGIEDDVTGNSLDCSEKIDASPEGCIRSSSSASAPTVLLAPTRTPSKLSVTIRICMHRGYFHYDSQEVRRYHGISPALRQAADPVWNT